MVYINEDLQAWGRIADILKVTQDFLSSLAPFQSTPKGSYISTVPTLLKTQHFYQLCRFEKNSLKKIKAYFDHLLAEIRRVCQNMYKEENIKGNHKEMVQNFFTPQDISNTDLSLQPRSKHQHRRPSSHHPPPAKGSLNSKKWQYHYSSYCWLRERHLLVLSVQAQLRALLPLFPH